MDEPMLSAVEVASILNMQVDTLYKWTRTGKGPKSVKVGRMTKFTRADLKDYIEGNRR